MRVLQGLSKAIERVEQLKEKAPENLSPNSYLAKFQVNSYGDDLTVPSYIEKQRLAAALRVKMRLQQEDAEVMKKLEQEEEQAKKRREVMEQKAEALRIKTLERVALLNVCSVTLCCFCLYYAMLVLFLCFDIATKERKGSGGEAPPGGRGAYTSGKTKR